MAATSIAIPRYIWDSLEAAIQAESRRLVRDIAQSLGQDDKALWNKVKAQKVSAYFVDMQDPTNEQFECEAFQLNAPVQRKCGRAVVYGTKACAEHSHTLHIKPDTTLPRYKVLKYENIEGIVEKAYLSESNAVLHYDTLEMIGEWLPVEKTIRLFIKV